MSFPVLIVEDDLNFRGILELRLRSWKSDLSLVFAESIKSAREILDNYPIFFPLVILDQNLPDGMGRELLCHQSMDHSSILAVSSDDSPELPAEAVRAGAHHFLSKRQVSEPLFIPLIEALMERARLEQALLEQKIADSKMNTIRTLLSTLRHEINNPLGAVLGGAYLMRTAGNLGPEQEKALKIIEASSNRIKHVLKQLLAAVELEEVTKAKERVYQVPGDPKWG